MSRRWFHTWGWVYRPVSWEGTLLVVVLLAFWVNVSLGIDRHSHSASDTMYGVFPYIVTSFLLLLWVAGKTSPE